MRIHFIIAAILFCHGVLLTIGVCGQESISKVRTAAENAFAGGDMKKAITLLSKLIELEPKNERNFYKRFRAYLSERKYASALSDLSSSLQVNPKYKQGILQRGKLYLMLGHCTEAVADFQKMIELHPNDTSAKEYLEKGSTCVALLDAANKAQSQGNYQVAYDQLSQIIETTGVSSVQLLMERAQLSISLGNLYDAIADLGIVLRLEPSNINALQKRGETLYAVGDLQSLEAALSHYRQGLHSDPEHKGLKLLYRTLKKLLKYRSRAKDAMASNKYEEAVEEWKNALEIDDTHLAMNKDMWLQLCESQIQLKLYEDARVSCEKTIQADASIAAAHAKLANILMRLEKYEDAVRSANQAVELDDSNNQYQVLQQRAEAALKQSKTKNYYKILGVKRVATTAEIKKAYRKQALEWHPDKHADKDEAELEKIQQKFHDIAEAYEILSDEDTRQRYDRGEDVTGQQQNQQPNPFNNMNFNFFQRGGQRFHFQHG